jgi:hypothetical protein
MDNSEFVFTQSLDEDGNKTIISGGYKINSFFLQSDQPIMSTITNNDKIYEDIQDGGKKTTSLEDLAVPAGLFYINQKVPKQKSNTNYENNHNILPEDIYDKLLSLVTNNNKPKKRFTKKHLSKNVKQRQTKRNKLK